MPVTSRFAVFCTSSTALARLGRAEPPLPEGLWPAAERVVPRPPPARALVSAVLRQAWHESRLRLWRRIHFRSSHGSEVFAAYRAMRPWEFEGVNARQAWANWRTIPRNLAGRAPRGPVRAIDLCCGTGQSTEVLAYCLVPGSRILGLESHPHFLDVARARTYRTRSGAPAQVDFRAQSVLEMFRDGNGAAIPDQAVDLVNSSGAVGCHFDREATALLAREVSRVLRSGGLALIDSGPAGTDAPQLQVIFAAHGFEAVHRARSCALDRYAQVCFRRLDRGGRASASTT